MLRNNIRRNVDRRLGGFISFVPFLYSVYFIAQAANKYIVFFDNDELDLGAAGIAPKGRTDPSFVFPLHVSRKRRDVLSRCLRCGRVGCAVDRVLWVRSIWQLEFALRIRHY